MTFSRSRSLPWQRRLSVIGLVLITAIACLLVATRPALAGLNDDRYDGEIFALYAGNGSLVPPKVTLAEALQRQKPALIVFYTDDSSDCKLFSAVVSQLQAFYGRVADFLPIRIDSLTQRQYSPSEEGFYYKGYVPQTVLINQQGKVVLDAKGKVAFEQIDDVFRQVFDLLPRSESVALKRRQVNEVSSELVK